jgi:hypothetical protein
VETSKIDISPDQRRAAQRCEDAAFLAQSAGDKPANLRSNPHGLGVVFSETPCQGPDQVTVTIQAENLNSCHACAVSLASELMEVPYFFSSPLKPRQILGVIVLRFWCQFEWWYVLHRR